MITFHVELNNWFFNHSSYQKLLDQLSIHCLTCPVCQCHNLIRWGFYNRHFSSASSVEIIRIQRMYCKSCGSTHALLPELFIPYSRISVIDAIMVIYAEREDHISYYETKDYNCEIDPITVSTILKKYDSNWKARLLAFSVSIKSDISSIISCSFEHYSKQFLQIKSTVNNFYLPPT